MNLDVVKKIADSQTAMTKLVGVEQTKELGLWIEAYVEAGQQDMASKEYVGQVAARAKDEAVAKTEDLKSLIIAMEQRLDAKFEKIDDKFEKLDNKVDSIEVRLNGRLDNMVFAFIAAAVSMIIGSLAIIYGR